ncbi:hypothetical protein [Streptomyces sp. NPDC055109]
MLAHAELAAVVRRAVLALIPGPDSPRTTVSVERRYDQLGQTATDSWTGDVTGFADRIADAFDNARTEEKDTRVGSQPTGASSTARAEILAVLQAAGYNEPAALELLKRADHEPRDPEPDPDFRETLAGGHALVVEYGDCELHATCQCGRRIGMCRPDASLDTFVPRWEQHTNTEVGRG